MFLCTLRLPSFRPRPCASRGSTNQNVAGKLRSLHTAHCVGWSGRSEASPAIEEAFAEIALHGTIGPCLASVGMEQSRLGAAWSWLLPVRWIRPVVRAARQRQGNFRTSSVATVCIAAKHAPRCAAQIALHNISAEQAAAEAARPGGPLGLSMGLGAHRDRVTQHARPHQGCFGLELDGEHP